jgi:hypothetical protein
MYASPIISQRSLSLFHAPKVSRVISLNLKTFLNHDLTLASTKRKINAKKKGISYITCQYLWKTQRGHFVSVFSNEVLVE